MQNSEFALLGLINSIILISIFKAESSQGTSLGIEYEKRSFYRYCQPINAVSCMWV